MVGLDPAIHGVGFAWRWSGWRCVGDTERMQVLNRVDGRIKSGHDGVFGGACATERQHPGNRFSLKKDHPPC
jgi:hypothetical protein